jgi:pimeloyl-ACP methyl ester carboxylesterase
MAWIHSLYNKYLTFDWTAAQSHLNRHKHFLATITLSNEPPVSIHYTQTLSPNPSAIPLILIHGWPGTFHEFDRVITHLTNPPSPTTQPSFHVIVPSCPGFCFSSPPPRRGWSQTDTAHLFHTLMLSLGYSRYAAQAGDWGMFVARALGSRYPDHCLAVHLNFCPTPLPEGIELTEREEKIEARCQAWLDDHLGYAVCMRSRPHTLGVSLVDNPVGILVWVGEKYLELAHPGTTLVAGTPACEAWEEAILTTVCLYYFSGCMMTSMLPYFENVKHAGFGEFVLREENRIRCPLGFTSYMYDSRPGTRRGVERSGNLVWYREVDEGGHFAALECPEGFVGDLREFMGEWFGKGS